MVDGVDGIGRCCSRTGAPTGMHDPYGRLWRAADLVREHRGDSHVAACVAAGLDPVRTNVLTETWVGYPVGEYSGTRAWPEEVHAAAVARLEADGMIATARSPAGAAACARASRPPRTPRRPS